MHETLEPRLVWPDTTTQGSIGLIHEGRQRLEASAEALQGVSEEM